MYSPYILLLCMCCSLLETPAHETIAYLTLGARLIRVIDGQVPQQPAPGSTIWCLRH